MGAVSCTRFSKLWVCGWLLAVILFSVSARKASCQESNLPSLSVGGLDGTSLLEGSSSDTLGKIFLIASVLDSRSDFYDSLRVAGWKPKSRTLDEELRDLLGALVRIQAPAFEGGIGEEDLRRLRSVLNREAEDPQDPSDRTQDGTGDEIGGSERMWVNAMLAYFGSPSALGFAKGKSSREWLATEHPECFQAVDSYLQGNAWQLDQCMSLVEEAGTNASELVSAWARCDREQQRGMRFLLANMPSHDLEKLSAQYLLEHVHGAYATRATCRWREQLTDEIFLDAVLPYASANESRDVWRSEFRERFQPILSDCSTPAQAAAKLNQSVFPLLDVRFSTQRNRANQGPRETMETHMASCTGLSILLIDACRSVGIPARLVGTPRWSDNSGNHSWVEIWSDGDWHFTGACEPSGDRLDEGWFVARASEAREDDPRYAIYATSFRKTGLAFPMVWSMRDRSVPGVLVTGRYAKRQQALEEGEIRVRIRVLDRTTGQRVQIPLQMVDDRDQELFHGESRDERYDPNDHLEWIVAKGTRFRVRMGDRNSEPMVAETPNQLFTLYAFE